MTVSNDSKDLPNDLNSPSNDPANSVKTLNSTALSPKSKRSSIRVAKKGENPLPLPRSVKLSESLLALIHSGDKTAVLSEIRKVAQGARNGDAQCANDMMGLRALYFSSIHSKPEIKAMLDDIFLILRQETHASAAKLDVRRWNDKSNLLGRLKKSIQNNEKKNYYIVCPTGWGKTTFCDIMINEFYDGKARFLFLISKNNILLQQTASRFLYPGLVRNYCEASAWEKKNIRHANLVVSSFQSCIDVCRPEPVKTHTSELNQNGESVSPHSSTPSLSSRFRIKPELHPENFDYIFVDELHNFIHNSGEDFLDYGKLVGMEEQVANPSVLDANSLSNPAAIPSQIGSLGLSSGSAEMAMPAPLSPIPSLDSKTDTYSQKSLLAPPSSSQKRKSIMLGFTATPFQGQKGHEKYVKNMSRHGEAFGKPFEEIGMLESINIGDLATINYELFKPSQKYEVNAVLDGTAELVIDEKTNLARSQAAVDLYIMDGSIYKNKLAIFFCPDQKNARYTEMLLNEKGVGAQCIVSDMADIDDSISVLRKNIYSGKTKAITCVDRLNEGFDIPETEAVFMLRPTLSSRLYLQQLGRGLRTTVSKKKVYVADFTENYNINGEKINALNLYEVMESAERILEKYQTGERDYSRQFKSAVIIEDANDQFPTNQIHYYGKCTADFIIGAGMRAQLSRSTVPLRLLEGFLDEGDLQGAIKASYKLDGDLKDYANTLISDIQAVTEDYSHALDSAKKIGNPQIRRNVLRQVALRYLQNTSFDIDIRKKGTAFKRISINIQLADNEYPGFSQIPANILEKLPTADQDRLYLREIMQLNPSDPKWKSQKASYLKLADKISEKKGRLKAKFIFDLLELAQQIHISQLNGFEPSQKINAVFSSIEESLFSEIGLAGFKAHMLSDKSDSDAAQGIGHFKQISDSSGTCKRELAILDRMFVELAFAASKIKMSNDYALFLALYIRKYEPGYLRLAWDAIDIDKKNCAMIDTEKIASVIKNTGNSIEERDSMTLEIMELFAIHKKNDDLLKLAGTLVQKQASRQMLVHIDRLIKFKNKPIEKNKGKIKDGLPINTSA